MKFYDNGKEFKLKKKVVETIPSEISFDEVVMLQVVRDRIAQESQSMAVLGDIHIGGALGGISTRYNATVGGPTIGRAIGRISHGVE